MEQTDAYFGDIQVQNEYCIQSSSSIGAMKPSCNPNSMPKIVNGQCKCQYPYTGSDCETCEKGFKQTKDSYKHAVCAVDLTRCSSDVCNSHGTCEESFSDISKVKCSCKPQYSGKFCEKCADPSLAYPDCDSKNGARSEIYSVKKQLPEYMQRSKYQSGGYETNLVQTTTSSTNGRDECLFSNFPTDLDRMEFMRFLP